MPDRGGFRVDTSSKDEVCRWVFPEVCEGLSELGRELTADRHFLKLCGAEQDLRNALPPQWKIQPTRYFMRAGSAQTDAKPLSDGYVIRCEEMGSNICAAVFAADGSLAARGHAAEAAGVFVYDRIETAVGHRRKGLGASVMSALGALRRSPAAPQLLVATEDGRKLYETLGWWVLSPYATAVIQ
ncbi:hypothetical protein GCM10027430_06570 [Lysobacter tyrosinilyticus]